MKNRGKQLVKRIIFVLLLLVIGLSIFVMIWVSNPYRASDRARSLLKSTDNYTFSTDQFLNFIPKIESSTGIIFCPGGLVEAEAYSPTCAAIASQGILCVILKMPLNLAILSPNSAGEVIQRYPGVSNWVIGGHSLGGAAAVRFLQTESGLISGLFLLGSYSDIDISNINVKAIALYGSKDMIFDAETLLNNQENLPKNTMYVEISGGNHSFFGDYGQQSGDGIAEITQTEHEKIVLDSIIDLFD